MSNKEPNKTTWATLLKKMLNECGLGYAWINQGVNDDTMFIGILRQRLRDMFVQNWWNEIAQTSNNRLYKHIKSDFRYEPYLDYCLRSYRLSLTKIRLSSHFFLVERGRWNKKMSIRNRLCEKCNVLEDEFHCLIECPRFRLHRNKYLPAYLHKNPSMFKFIAFMKDNCYESCVNLATLCFRVLNEYKNDCL